MIRDYTAIIEVKFQDLMGDMDDQEVCDTLMEELERVFDAELIHVLEVGKDGSQRRLVLERPLPEPAVGGPMPEPDSMSEVRLGPSVNFAYSRENEQYAGVMADNRDTLVAAVERTAAAITVREGSWPLSSTGEKEPILKVMLPCGNVRQWAIKDWIPYDSVECYCGSAGGRHFFVLYTDPAYTDHQERPKHWWEMWR